MATVVWLTGRTCVGKSTWSRAKLSRNTQMLSTGDVARVSMTNDSIAASHKPVSPPEVEGVVRSAIVEAQKNLLPDDVLIIDSFPRSVEQVEWLKSTVANFGQHLHHVLYAVCPEQERSARIIERSRDPQKLELLRSRLAVEDTVFIGVFEALISANLDVRVLNLQSGVSASPVLIGSQKTDLVSMFASHAELNDEALVRFDLSSKKLLESVQHCDRVDPFSPNAVWLRRFLERAKDEIDEALECLPEKWWTVDQADLRSLRVELIDVWHFLMSAAIASGLSAEDFSQLYFEKRALNLARWRSGKYSAKKNGVKDDGHLGKSL